MGELGGNEDTDLFGPENEEYSATAATSPWKPPRLAVETSKVPSRDHFQRAAFPRHAPVRTPLPSLNGKTAVPDTAYDFFSGGSTVVAPPPTRIALFPLGLPGHKDASLHTCCPQIQQPAEIAMYSRRADGSLHWDDSCLRQFRPAVLGEQGADLNVGFDSFVDKAEDGEAVFGHLLAAVRKSGYPLQHAHFVTFRNNLNKVMGCCYDRATEWEMGVHRRGPTLYLHVHKLPEKPRSVQDRRMAYYGYAFERLATEAGTREEEESGAVNANAEFCALLKTKLGETRILMAAELDCYEPAGKGGRTYVELKASRELRDERDKANFERFKLQKFWIQSFLAGVPKIVCAFRDDNGRVVRSEAMSMKDITDRVKVNGYWQGGPILAFTHKVLGWLYESTGKEDADCLLRFTPKRGQLELFRATTPPPLALQEHCRLVAGRGS